MDRECLKNILIEINFDNIKYFEELYYCREEINSISEIKNEETIIEKFIYSYLGKVKALCRLNEKQAGLFIKWYNEKGKYNFIPLLDNMQYDKINVISLIKTITRYELLLEQSIFEENIDGLLNFLIDMPKNIYSKLTEWGCFSEKEFKENIIDELIGNKISSEVILQEIVNNIKYNVNNEILNKINNSYCDLSLMCHKLKLSENKELQKVYYIGMLYAIIGIHNIVEREQPKNKNIGETLEKYKNLDKIIETIYNESVIDTDSLACKAELTINDVNKLLSETRFLDK